MAAPKETSLVGDTLTEREREIMSKAWRCLKTSPEIDFTKLAAECNMTNVGSASNAWSKIKKKLFSDLPSAGISTGQASNRKRKQVTKEEKNATAITTKSSASVPAHASGNVPTEEAAPDKTLDENSQNDPIMNDTTSFTPINAAPKRRRNAVAGGTARARMSKEAKASGSVRDKKANKEEGEKYKADEMGHENGNIDIEMKENSVDENSGI